MLKIIVGLALAVTLACAANLVGLEATNDSQGYRWLDVQYVPMAAHGDTIISAEIQDPSNSSSTAWVVFKLVDGQYSKVASVPQEVRYLSQALNNGDWMGGWTSTVGVHLFRLEANNKVIAEKLIPVPDDTDNVALLSDNTIVYLSFANGTFRSLKFNDDSTWSDGPVLALENPIQMTLPQSSYWIDDNHIIYVNQSYWTYIYTRQSDGSWKLTDGFAFDVETINNGVDNPFSLYYNGDGTVVFAFPQTIYSSASYAGYIVFYTKVNNDWQWQVITMDDVGFIGTSAQLGQHSFAAINSKNLVFGAEFEGFVMAPPPGNTKRGGPTFNRAAGKALLVQFQNDTWVPIAKIYTPTFGLLASAVSVTNRDIVMTFTKDASSYFMQYLFTVPVCIVKPINATCYDRNSDTCEIDVATTDAFSVSPCLFETKTYIKHVKDVDTSLHVTFEFERMWAPLATCNSTITCPGGATPVKPPVKPSISNASVLAIYSMVMSVVALLIIF